MFDLDASTLTVAGLSPRPMDQVGGTPSGPPIGRGAYTKSASSASRAILSRDIDHVDAWLLGWTGT